MKVIIHFVINVRINSIVFILVLYLSDTVLTIFSTTNGREKKDETICNESRARATRRQPAISN